MLIINSHKRTAVTQWLGCCATNSIPAGVIGIFIDIKSFRSYYGTGHFYPKEMLLVLISATGQGHSTIGRILCQ